jgi:hypothetical protein
MLPHCHLGIVGNQTAYPLEPYSLSPTEVHSSTSSVNQEVIVIKLSIQLVILNEAEYNWEYWRQQWRLAEWRTLISFFFITGCGVSLQLYSREIRLRKWNQSHTHPAFLCYMLEMI